MSPSAVVLRDLLAAVIWCFLVWMHLRGRQRREQERQAHKRYCSRFVEFVPSMDYEKLMQELMPLPYFSGKFGALNFGMMLGGCMMVVACIYEAIIYASVL